MRNFLVIGINLVLLWVGVANAYEPRTYYVSPAGNDGNSGESNAPLRSVQKAADMANPGDTVIVKEGVYTDTDGDDRIVSIKRSGTAAHWITFRSEKKWGAVLDGQTNTTDFGFLFSSRASYIRVEGFEIKGTAIAGFHSNSQSHDIYLYANNMHDIGRVCTSITNGRSGVFQGRGTSYHTYDSNVFHTIGRLPDCGDLLHLYQHDHGIYAFGNNNTIINNIFYDLKAGWAIQISGGTGKGDGPNWDIINNTFVGANPSREGQIVVWTEKKGNKPTNLTIQNNISYNSNGSFVYFYRNLDGSGYRLNNNLVYGTKTSLASSEGILPDYGSSDNIIGKDPVFIDVSEHNYHLGAGSPAIDAALSADAPRRDFDGNDRPYGVAFDIGAYEYVPHK